MDYNTIAADNLNSIMREIAEYSRMAEEITATLDGLKDTLKKYMDLTISPGPNTKQVINRSQVAVLILPL